MQRNSNPRESTKNFIDGAYRVFIEKHIDAMRMETGVGLLANNAEIRATTEMLGLFKDEIITRAFFVLGFKQGQDLTDEQRAQFQRKLEGDLVHSCIHLPSFFEGGDELENPNDSSFDSLSPEQHQKNKNKLTARNYLRVFVRGTKVGADNAWFWESPLATPELFQTIMTKGDPDLEAEVRNEIQAYLNGAFDYINLLKQFSSSEVNLLDEEKNSNSRKQQIEERFQSHLGPLLTSMAFFKYNENDEVDVPVKVKNTDNGTESWQKVKYRVQKLDLSPRPVDGGFDGIIGRLLREEDRFYIYGLEPVGDNKDANPILAWSGTPPDGVAGSDVATTYNVIGGKAIAEAHNTQSVRDWIEAHENIVSYGHSKGGMGQIFVAEYPDHFKSFEGLCGGLHSATLERLKTIRKGKNKLTWEERIQQSKLDPSINLPKVIVNDQLKDVVFPIDQGFLPDTIIRHILTGQAPALNAYPIPRFFAERFQHHSFSLLGHPDVIILNGDLEKENKRPLRSFLDTGKNILGYFVGFQKKSHLIVKLVRREINEFCIKHRTKLVTGLFIATLAAEVFLLTSGIGAGFSGYLTAFLLKTFPLSANAASVSTTALLSIGSVTLGAGLSYVEAIPKALNVVFDLAFIGADILYTLTTRALTLLLVTPSAIKNLSLSLYRDPQPLKDFGNYLLSLQIIPDLISGVISISKGIVEGLFYILPKVLWWKMRSSSCEKRVVPDVYQSLTTSGLLQAMPSSSSASATVATPSQTAVRQNTVGVSAPSPVVPVVVATTSPRRKGMGLGCSVS